MRWRRNLRTGRPVNRRQVRRCAAVLHVDMLGCLLLANVLEALHIWELLRAGVRGSRGAILVTLSHVIGLGSVRKGLLDVGVRTGGAPPSRSEVRVVPLLTLPIWTSSRPRGASAGLLEVYLASPSEGMLAWSKCFQVLHTESVQGFCATCLEVFDLIELSIISYEF